MIEFNDEAIEATCDLHPEYLKKDICMEECAELIKAISKCERDKNFKADTKSLLDTMAMTPEHHDNECEEIADVLIAIRYLMYYDMHTEDEIQWWIDFKTKRQMIRDYETFRNIIEQDNPDEAYFSDQLNDYYKKCKEAYDAQKLYERESKKPVSNE